MAPDRTCYFPREAIYRSFAGKIPWEKQAEFPSARNCVNLETVECPLQVDATGRHGPCLLRQRAGQDVFKDLNHLLRRAGDGQGGGVHFLERVIMFLGLQDDQ